MFKNIYALALATTGALATPTTYYAKCQLESDTSTLIAKQNSGSSVATFDIELIGSWPTDYLYLTF